MNSLIAMSYSWSIIYYELFSVYNVLFRIYQEFTHYELFSIYYKWRIQLFSNYYELVSEI